MKDHHARPLPTWYYWLLFGVCGTWRMALLSGNDCIQCFEHDLHAMLRQSPFSYCSWPGHWKSLGMPISTVLKWRWSRIRVAAGTRELNIGVSLIILSAMVHVAEKLKQTSQRKLGCLRWSPRVMLIRLLKLPSTLRWPVCISCH